MKRMMGSRLLTALVAAATMMVALVSARAEEPAVQGPETVQDWWAAGQRFIQQSKSEVNNNRRARNVIFFVGDGMGISTVNAAHILEGQLKGQPGEENRLFFETFPNLALSKTYSWDQQTPDSAPTMTAMVTGYKARESMLSVDHTTRRHECDANVIAQKSLKSILEQAAETGRWTGVVSTARLTHATPGANYGHTAVRDWESDDSIRAFEQDNGLPANACTVKDIAAQLIDLAPRIRTSLKVAMGGGRRHFLPDTVTDPEDGGSARGNRKDGRDLPAEWVGTRGAGAKWVYDRKGFDEATPTTTEYLLGLFERSHMEYEFDRASDKGGEPSLTEMTERAIQMLSKSPRGFYLHVESGRIDHAHHAGNPYRALTDTIEFAKAIQKAYEMTNPRDTLIIVTADHSHVFTIAGYPHRGNPILGLVREVPEKDGDPTQNAKDLLGLPYTTLGYTNGPGYTGVSRDSKDAVLQQAGVKSYPHSPAKYENGTSRPDLTAVDTTAPSFMPEAAVPLNSETHAGEDVAIYATGPRAHLVRGVMEQNWIYHVMKDAFGL